jgi:hypothetical protein
MLAVEEELQAAYSSDPRATAVVGTPTPATATPEVGAASLMAEPAPGVRSPTHPAEVPAAAAAAQQPPHASSNQGTAGAMAWRIARSCWDEQQWLLVNRSAEDEQWLQRAALAPAGAAGSAGRQQQCALQPAGAAAIVTLLAEVCQLSQLSEAELQVVAAAGGPRQGHGLHGCSRQPAGGCALPQPDAGDEAAAGQLPSGQQEHPVSIPESHSGMQLLDGLLAAAAQQLLAAAPTIEQVLAAAPAAGIPTLAPAAADTAAAETQHVLCPELEQLLVKEVCLSVRAAAPCTPVPRMLGAPFLHGSPSGCRHPGANRGNCWNPSWELLESILLHWPAGRRAAAARAHDG